MIHGSAAARRKWRIRSIEGFQWGEITELLIDQLNNDSDKWILVPCPNVSTKPITAMGRRQCLPLSII